MSLEQYRKKRHFDQTAEPKGSLAPAGGTRFVVQKHAASHLHYDFRLELDGVLKSWAIPKGPNLNPAVKALAVHVEDHPIEYASFEGTIAEGEYGAGTVMVWDEGTWEPVGDARRDYERGSLTFRLAGQKLRGRWKLLKMRGKAGQDGKNWLLIKIKDEEAIGPDDAPIVDRAPRSVVSGRTLEEIAEGSAFPPRSNGNKARTPRGSRASRSRAVKQSRNGHTGHSVPGKPTEAVLHLSHPDRVLYPEGGFTKRDLAEYYMSIAAWILPHLVHRPLTVVRCPEGRQRACFFQRHMGPGMPKAIRAVEVPEKGGTEQGLAVDDAEGLVALAQIGVLEIHPWGSREDRLDRPDRLIFDLDPGEGIGSAELVRAALEVRDRLDTVGLASFVRTSGGKGLHIVAPIARTVEWARLKAFAHAFATTLERDDPKHFLARAARPRRAGKIYVDYLRNEQGATAVASYSSRARPGATVAAPLAWDELDAGLDPQAFDLRTVPRRLAGLHHDPWDGFFTLRQRLPRALVHA